MNKPTYEELEAQVKRLSMQLELSVAAERAWETTMMRVCGEDGPLSVAGKFNQLAAERDAVNADNVYLRDQVICWARECDRITFTYTNKVTDAHQMEAEQELANTLADTDAILASLRAEGVEMALTGLLSYLNHDVDIGKMETKWDVSSAVVDYINAQLRSKSEVQP